MKNSKKGMPIGECVKKAEKIISEKGICLLLFDVINSRECEDRSGLNRRINRFMEEINYTFGEYLPENRLATPERRERGFQTLLGDGSWAGINSAEAIPAISDYQKEHFPDLLLYWAVAKNGYDPSADLVR